MKKYTHFTSLVWSLLIGGILILPAGCGDAKENQDDDPVAGPIRFTSQISDAALVETKAVGAVSPSKEKWQFEDAIGVFMKRNGTQLPEGIVDDIENYRYVAQNAGARCEFIPANIQNEIRYPAVSSVEFAAYYPYTSSLRYSEGDIFYPINITNQDIDLLYVDSSNSDNGTASNLVPLQFEHQLSKFTLNIQLNHVLQDRADISKVGVKLHSYIPSAEYSFRTHTFSAKGAKSQTPMPLFIKKSFEDPYKEVNAYAIAEAVLIPQTVSESNPYITIQLPRKSSSAGSDYTYTWELPISKLFQSGKDHQYTLLLNLEGVQFISESITKWTAGNSANGTFSFENPFGDIARISGGNYMIGTRDTLRAGTLFPRTRSAVSTFYMTQEITATEYALFLNSVGVEADGCVNNALYIHPGGNNTYGSVEYSPITKRWQPAVSVLLPENGLDYPVTNVTWSGANAFAKWLGGNLPTEHQWEIACRAEPSIDYPYSFGSLANEDFRQYANCKYTANNIVPDKPVTILALRANAYGLYNMYGNVAEWCRDACDWQIVEGNRFPLLTNTECVSTPDVYGLEYSNGGDRRSGRIVRGGSYKSNIEVVHSCARQVMIYDHYDSDLGFRIVFPENYFNKSTNSQYLNHIFWLTRYE